MDLKAYWQYLVSDVLKTLRSTAEGLSAADAAQRLASSTKKEKEKPQFVKDIILFFAQFKSPLTLLLVAAVILSAFLGETSDVFIILFILLATGIMSFIQERHAGLAVEKLRSLIRSKVKVQRSNTVVNVYSEEIVPGDIIVFAAGDIIPADCLLLEEKDLHANEATLTGETYPAEKEAGVIAADTGMSKRTNVLFEGTSIVSGTGKAVAVFTGKDTVFGAISASLTKAPEETAFEKGIRKFGYLLMQITLVLAVIILAVNIYFHKPLIDSLLFALALAVGMAPELLPAIMTVAMSAGSKRMAKQKVIVKKLSSIQNLGEINLFCSDKTGTLTEGVLKISGITGIDGNENETVKQLAYLNAFFETGFSNPMDDALKTMDHVTADGYEKTDEIPYDFIRKRLSVVVVKDNKHQLISKGAIDNIIAVCDTVLLADGSTAPIQSYKKNIDDLYQQYSGKGFRTVGVCYKDCAQQIKLVKEDEQQMIFAGFVLLQDPIKPGVIDVIKELNNNGVQLKMITGDNKLVAAYIGEQIGLHKIIVISGAAIAKMSPEALVQQVQKANVFAEIEPQQKENIIKALRKAGNTVAYMGDGINDVAAINAADVGISTNNAVDVAKEAADVVLLEKDLAVLNAGILEGRRTFLNTLKYIYTNTSATFGNMFSMAGASLLLPFLPMLPQQILLTNFLTDFPYMAVAGDNVDEADLKVPQRWNLKQLKNFMIVFGLHSSVFDYITFFLLYRLFKSETVFQTGWFIESICTELLILFVVRTHKSLLKSVPGKLLIALSALSLVVTIILPFTPFATALGFVVPPLKLLGIIAGILLLYVITADIIKVIFFRKAAI
ncbi:magnesium-translocating P-type ATPase [Ferruginibacter sp. SUN106]|uniref:magnesium-translocating P-type ATPase n=1 Tax=Ferruginibacter sp. SUN106 TaxID=2978348 RepID=UPI003D35A5B7